MENGSCHGIFCARLGSPFFTLCGVCFVLFYLPLETSWSYVLSSPGICFVFSLHLFCLPLASVLSCICFCHETKVCPPQILNSFKFVLWHLKNRLFLFGTWISVLFCRANPRGWSVCWSVRMSVQDFQFTIFFSHFFNIVMSPK